MLRYVGFAIVLSVLVLTSNVNGEASLNIQVNGQAYTGQTVAQGDTIAVTWQESVMIFGGFSAFELTVGPASYVANSFVLAQPASWLANTLMVTTPVGDGFTIAGSSSSFGHPAGDVFSFAFTVPGGLNESDVISILPTSGSWLGILFDQLPSAQLTAGSPVIDPNTLLMIDTWQVKADMNRWQPQDSANISGMFKATADQFAGADQVQVILETDVYLILDETVDIATEHLQEAKVNYSGDGPVRALKLDFAKGSFAIQIQDTDLSGLSSPAILKIHFGGYSGQGQSDETVLNGKKPLSLCLLNGVLDVLRADKVKLKETKNGDSLLLSGAIADEDMVFDMPNEAVTLHWGGFSETIAAHSFIEKKPGVYLYKNKTTGNGKFITALLVDLARCKLKLIIKNATLDKQGDVVFALDADGFSAQTTVTLD